MHSFFFRKLQLIKLLLLIWNYYVILTARFISLRVSVEFSIFDTASFLLKFINCLTKSMDSKTSLKSISAKQRSISQAKKFMCKSCKKI